MMFSASQKRRFLCLNFETRRSRQDSSLAGAVRQWSCRVRPTTVDHGVEESPPSQPLLSRGEVVVVRSRILRGSGDFMFDAGAAAVAVVLVWIKCWRKACAVWAAWVTDATVAKGCRTADTIRAAEAGEAEGCRAAGVTRAAEEGEAEMPSASCCCLVSKATRRARISALPLSCFFRFVRACAASVSWLWRLAFARPIEAATGACWARRALLVFSRSRLASSRAWWSAVIPFARHDIFCRNSAHRGLVFRAQLFPEGG